MCGRQVAGNKLEHTFHLWKTTNMIQRLDRARCLLS
jgi:hypothetical protein